jgi:2-polyprenyl-3-methyl-5-hydroxy-6-metoxy-1,4-benzoquinol methylase
MLRFRHDNEQVELTSGALWKAPKQGESYRDTSAEMLWGIISEIESGSPWQEVVTQKYAANFPWLYQIITSPARDLFFRQHPPSSGTRVLDVGAGWGQISLPLSRQAGVEVTALEPTHERIAFIRAVALQEKSAGHMHFIQADFQSVTFDAAFDLVCCIGVLEWVPKFRAGDPRTVQLEFLRRMHAALQPGGKCCVGIENRFGLKYLLGSRDDHTGLRNVSVLEAALASSKHHVATAQELRAFTYTHAEYEILFREAGFTQIQTHAAFPDYKLPQLILPYTTAASFNQSLLNSEIPREHDGIDGQPLDHPEEFLSHYRSLAGMGIAQFFSPSFFFLLQ